MLRCICCAGVIVICASAVLAQVQPVLTISFDEGLDGAGREGPVTGTPAEKPALAAGKVGQALKSGPDTGYVEYPTEGLVRPGGGTVEMWVCPLDWEPGDEEFHAFFDVRGEGALYLYKYYQGVRLLMLSCDNVSGPYFSSACNLDWEPGEWHHVAGTWSAQGVMSYVDGQPAAAMPVEAALPSSLGPTFLIGDHPWHLPRTSSSLVDEVRLYDRPLTPAHIAAHYRGDYEFRAPLTAETVTLRREVDPVEGMVTVRLGTGADVEDERLKAQLALAPAGSDFPEAAPSFSFAGGQVVESLRLPSREPGAYEVLARIYLDGEQAMELRREVIIPRTGWEGNDLGMEDRVLPPWTPLEVEDGTVRCWGRQYSFGDSPLPLQITSGGRELLAGEPVLRLSSGEQSVAWRSGTREQTLSPARTRLQASGSLSGVLGDQPVRVDVRTTVEYDGLMLVELSLPPGQRPELDGMSLEIPVRAEHALYRHRWAPTWPGVTGNLPEGEAVVDSDKFIPYYWLGDNDRGLFWFCESDEMWPNGQGANAVEVERAGEQVLLRLNLLAAGQELPADWRFAFGLQATPVKPIPKDWRKWRLQPGRNATVSIIWPTPNPDSLKHYGYPEATDPELFAGRVGELHAQGVKVVPYLCLSFISTACPEWPFFRKYWAMGPVATPSDVARYGAGFAMASPLGKGYSDFIIWKNNQFIDRYGIDGLYHDNTHPYSSANLEAGVGYERDGKAHRTFPILGFRDLYRRMYAVIKSLPRETFTMAHMSGKVTIPILAYDDSYLDGEHFRGKVKDSYMDVVSLDTFRAEFMGRQWGVMPFFIPEFSGEYATQVEPTRGMMALMMIHDVSPWPIWCNVEVVNEAFAALDEFGYVDADFIGYFDANPPATTDLPDVYVSAYQKEGQALLVIGNLSREERSGAVTVSEERLGLARAQAVSWPEKRPLEYREGRLSVTVPGLGYQMVVITAGD